MNAIAAPAARKTATDAFEDSVRHLKKQRLGKRFSPVVEARLGLLPVALELEVRSVLHTVGRNSNTASPADWAEATRLMNVGALAEAACEIAKAGVGIYGVGALVTSAALDALEVLVHNGRWSPINLGRILRAIRLMHRVIHGRCPDVVGSRLTQLAGAARIFKWHRVADTSEYVRGAWMLGAFARVGQVAGWVRGDSLARDAAMLALEAEAALRLGELAALDVGMIKWRTIAGRPVLEIHVSRGSSKSRVARIARLFDSRSLELLTPLLNATPSTPLFRTESGERLTKAAMWVALARTSRVVIGEAGSCNLLRRAAVRGAPDRETARKRVGHVPGSRITEAFYNEPAPATGHALITTASAAKRAAFNVPFAPII